MKNFKLITIILGLVAFMPIMPKGPEDVDINPPSQIDNQPLSGDDDDEDTERAFALESSNNGEDTKTVGTNPSTLNLSRPTIRWSQSVEPSASPESTVNITSGPASGLNDAQAMDGMLNRGQAGAPYESPQDLGLGARDVKKSTNDTYIRVNGVGEVGFDDENMYAEPTPYIEVGDDKDDNENSAIFEANSRLTQRPAVTSGDQLSEPANESVSGVGDGVRYSGVDADGVLFRMLNNGKEEFFNKETGEWMSERDYRKKQRNKDWRSRLSYWKDIIVRKLKSLAEFPYRAKKELYRKIEDYAMKKVFEKSPEKRKQDEQTNITINRIQDINNKIARLRRLRDNPIDDEDANNLDAAIKEANKNLWDVVRENARLRR